MKLQIIEHKIDWLKIINLAFNKKDWGKTYIMYVHKDVNITVTMREFNFERNMASFKIVCNYPKDDMSYEWENYLMAEFFLDNYKLEEFKNIISKKVTRLLKIIIDGRKKRIAEKKYQKLKYFTFGLKEEDIKLAGKQKDYDAILKVEDKDMQEKLIEEFKYRLVEKLNEPYNDKIEKYIERGAQPNEELEELLKNLQKNEQSE